MVLRSDLDMYNPRPVRFIQHASLCVTRSRPVSRFASPSSERTVPLGQSKCNKHRCPSGQLPAGQAANDAFPSIFGVAGLSCVFRRWVCNGLPRTKRVAWPPSKQYAACDSPMPIVWSLRARPPACNSPARQGGRGRGEGSGPWRLTTEDGRRAVDLLCTYWDSPSLRSTSDAPTAGEVSVSIVPNPPCGGGVQDKKTSNLRHL
ncbi:hypothetical protein F4808DRAFT_321756 [Astrocystis sublimbata]|nr:hypothetical protein F4808DRAFT_321756 [Astrocystis sublimbata]